MTDTSIDPAVAHQLRAIAGKPNLLAGWQQTHGLSDDATVPQVLAAVAAWLDGGTKGDNRA